MRNQNVSLKVLFNASVVISGLISKKGGSAKLLMYAKKRKITGFISESIANEILAKSNKIGVKKTTVEKTINSIFVFIKSPSSLNVKTYKGIVIDSGDAHVLASAKELKCNYLVSLDKKHILSLKEKIKEFNIVNTKELLEAISQKK